MSAIAAFFDMDHTIIWENSGLSSARLAKQFNMMTHAQLIKGVFKIVLYRLALLDINKWYESNIAGLKGMPIEDMERFSSLWFESMVKKKIYKEALELMHDHQNKGRPVVIISNAPSFFVLTVAKALNVQNTISTRLETKDGILTGRLLKPLCYGEGKRDYAVSWAGENDIDLKESYFYTDSHFDLAMLKIVGHPVATNPDFRLRRIASKNNWPILDFDKIPAF
jgi:putative phosphoserine phosphatase/1-acylglycerol-3-phosphate O-acyltransferase